ncbi:hypothetical protein D0864_00800 [Hortaea werneckii]|uniref:Uncharacterized protein n=1 Tax=Hortaea werneckii TaxID=91943 RepID=A0A3M7HFM5_HORWE|nr:hypothetical protein D0864_00800 [Hortaea werneckii]
MTEQISASAKSSTQPPSPYASPMVHPNGISVVYDLHCHSAAIRYKIRISPPLYAEHAKGREQCVAVACECSDCMRNGYWRNIEWTHGREHIKLHAHGGTEGKNPFWHLRCLWVRVGD